MPYRRTPAIQARIDAQRTGVLHAATELLRERGYAGCSITAVAAKAGVATGTVYRHFPSKTELVVELFRAVVGREVAAVAEASRAHDGLVARVIAVTETFASRAMKSPRLAYALLAEPVDPAVEAERLVFRRTFRDLLAGPIAEGVGLGVLPPQDPRLTAAALVGAVAEALVGPLAEGDLAAAAVPELVNFTLRALGVPESSGGIDADA
ncbi:MAG TPA: TetR/AcrR family transcriptional regulator [Micromonosporaceae bacterium]|jgi:AcrR family transcriptional regulator|nr:TetR/AcrR family transcriptional regulator [Micromonosporaceae bacterium]